MSQLDDDISAELPPLQEQSLKRSFSWIGSQSAQRISKRTRKKKADGNTYMIPADPTTIPYIGFSADFAYRYSKHQSSFSPLDSDTFSVVDSGYGSSCSNFSTPTSGSGLTSARNSPCDNLGRDSQSIVFLALSYHRSIRRRGQPKSPSIVLWFIPYRCFETACVSGSNHNADNAPTFRQQVQNALDNVDKCLHASGARKSDIVSIRQYVVRLSQLSDDDRKERGMIIINWWQETEAERAPPPSTLIGVESLVTKETLYEIEVACVVDSA